MKSQLSQGLKTPLKVKSNCHILFTSYFTTEDEDEDLEKPSSASTDEQKGDNEDDADEEEDEIIEKNIAAADSPSGISIFFNRSDITFR